MPNVFCPLCSGRVHYLQVPVVTVRVHPVYGESIEVKLGRAVVCEGCSLVSEVSEAGQLIDLGSITLAEIDVPVVPGIDAPRVFMQSGATLLWRRRDS